MKTISYDDYLKLKGLLALAGEHNRALDGIQRAAATITGDPEDWYGYFGCTSDECSDPRPDAERLLNRLEITVEEASRAA